MDAYDKDIWEAGRKFVSAIWDALGWYWHGKFYSKNRHYLAHNSDTIF